MNKTRPWAPVYTGDDNEYLYPTYLYQELHHFSVDKTMDCFSIHMSDEISSFESCFMCWSTVFYILNKRGIITVTIISLCRKRPFIKRL